MGSLRSHWVNLLSLCPWDCSDRGGQMAIEGCQAKGLIVTDSSGFALLVSVVSLPARPASFSSSLPEHGGFPPLLKQLLLPFSSDSLICRQTQLLSTISQFPPPKGGTYSEQKQLILLKAAKYLRGSHNVRREYEGEKDGVKRKPSSPPTAPSLPKEIWGEIYQKTPFS